MTEFYKKNKRSIITGIILVLVLLGLWYILENYKNFDFKREDTKTQEIEKIDVADNSDYLKYENKVGNINFTFLHPKDTTITRGTGSQQNWFKVVDADKKNNVTVYLTNVSGKNWSVDEYISNVFDTDASSTLKIQEVKFSADASSTMKYVLNENANAEYYLAPANEDGWLYIVENENAKDEASQKIAKDIFRSFEVVK